MANDFTPHYMLSHADRMILESYKDLTTALGLIFGSTCEIVLHSLEDLDHSVIAIHNSEKTGRKVGSPVTDKALNVLRECEQHPGNNCSGLYLTKSAAGHTMRSVTNVIRGVNGQPIGLICINFDIATPLNELCAALLTQPPQSSNDGEHFAHDIEDFFITKVKQVQTAVLADKAIPQRQKIKAIILRLNEEGVFKLRRSVTRIAAILNVSRDVIYMHLRNLEKDSNKLKEED